MIIWNNLLTIPPAFCLFNGDLERDMKEML